MKPRPANDQAPTSGPSALKQVAKVLVEAAESGKPTDRGVQLQLDLTRRDIGSVLGLSRADATRLLNTLKREGIIAIEGSTVVLLDIDALRKLSEQV